MTFTVPLYDCRGKEEVAAALRFPYLHTQKLITVVLVVLLVLSSLSLAGWGITGAGPHRILEFALTGHPSFKLVIKHDDEGKVIKDTIVYRLGAPEILEDCIARTREHIEQEQHRGHMHVGEGELVSWGGDTIRFLHFPQRHVGERGELVSWVRCVKQ